MTVHLALVPQAGQGSEALRATRQVLQHLATCRGLPLTLTLWQEDDLPGPATVDAVLLDRLPCARRWALWRRLTRVHGPGARALFFRIPPALKDLTPLRDPLAASLDLAVVVPYGVGPQALAHALRVAVVLAQRRGRHLTVVASGHTPDPAALRAEAAAIAPDLALDVAEPGALFRALLWLPETLDVVLLQGRAVRYFLHAARSLLPSPALLPEAWFFPAPDRPHGLWGVYGPAVVPADAAQALADDPLGHFFAAAWMLRLSLNMNEAARAMEEAVNETLAQGLRPLDLALDQEPLPPRSLAQAVQRLVCASGPPADR